MGGNRNLKRSRDEAKLAGEETGEAVENGANHPQKKACTVFVRSLPGSATAETLTDFFSQHYPVKHSTVVIDPVTKTSKGYGFVTFTDPEDARNALEKLQGDDMEGRRIRLDIAEPRNRKGVTVLADNPPGPKERRQEDAKPSKLIIRNLPWSVKRPEQLERMFRRFGKVKFVDLPNEKGKLKGFAFVTMRGHKNAEKALETMNGTQVDGRTIAVDWAVTKEQWEKQHSESDKKPQAKTEPENGTESGDVEGSGENEDDEEVEEVEEVEEAEEETDEDDEDAELVEDAESPQKQLMSSNSNTVFIRNLPYSTTDEDLKSHFEQFGRIRYARVVMDRASDRPAGTGFVCFVSGDDCTSCLKAAPRPQPKDQSRNLGKRSLLQDETADPTGLYTIDGRVLEVSQAVSKEEAGRLASISAQNRQEQDKRRHFLLSEGVIPQGSKLHALLSDAEIKIRDQSLAQRKKQMQSNPNLRLSLHRLAIRNIPRNINSKDLKALARQAVVEFAKDVKQGLREPLSKEELSRGGDGDKEAEHKRKEKGKGIVKQSKIMFENDKGGKVPEQETAKSRGYGFVEYFSHRHALMALRWLNGHVPETEYIKKNGRLIVEFAIEHAQVVQRRKGTEMKSRQTKE